MAPYLAMLIEDPYPAVRYIAARSLKRLAGYEDFSYDYVAAPDVLLRSRERAFEIWTKTAKPLADASLLLENTAVLDQKTVTNLLQSRDNRVVELNE